MAAIEWDQAPDRIYEVGLDHGVLYLDNEVTVPWNGLTSVGHNPETQNTEPLFFDGKKYGDLQNRGSVAVEIGALTYPSEFSAYLGIEEVETGLSFNSQDKKTFSMAYRTLIGDGIQDLDLGYRIHILYNLVAVMDQIDNETLGDDISPMEFGWKATGQEEIVPGHNPTAYVIADSRYLEPGALLWLNYMLFGTEFSDPFLPPLEELIERLTNSYVITISDHGDGTWTAEGPDLYFTFASATEFQIDGVDATYLDADTYEVSST